MTTSGRARRAWAGAAALLVATGACSYSEERERARAADVDSLRVDTELIASLQPFDACDDLLDYLRTEGATVVGPYGFGGGVHALATGGAVATSQRAAGSAATSGGDSVASAESAPAPVAAPAAGTDYSGTNVQEAGVDEPDLVTTDGRRLVTFAGGQLRVVDLSGGEARLAASLRIADRPYGEGELLLHGDRVVVLHAELPDVMPVEPMPMPTPLPPGARPGAGAAISRSPHHPITPRAAVTVVDISDLAAPAVVEEVVVDGHLVAARMVDGVARLVLRSGPPNLPFLYPSGSEESVDVATEANKKVVANSTLEDWLPSYEVGGGEPRRLTECSDVSRPEVFSGLGMLSVVTVDADDPRPGPAATVLGAGDTVYASTEHLYVTSSAWTSPPLPRPGQEPGRSGMPDTSTEIHKFDIADEVRTSYLASGRVKGRLLNSFSMSEHEGALRVATTDDVAQESAVHVLREQDGALELVGGVGGLGKTERIFAVRFLGDRGYVVTFRQTDPLYVIDLADPTRPEVKGELKIPGYSAYLHPIGDHRLVGVGQDADDTGRIQGTQVSLFDVSDPTDPKRLAHATLRGAHSEAEHDHHAFLWWAPRNLAVIPVIDHRMGTSTAVGFTVADGQVAEAGRVPQRDRQPIRRSVVVGDRLLTLSDAGLQTNDLATLTEQAWLPY